MTANRKTPRTDAIKDTGTRSVAWELCELARTLERELAAAEAKIAGLTMTVENLQSCEICEADLITLNPDQWRRT